MNLWKVTVRVQRGQSYRTEEYLAHAETAQEAYTNTRRMFPAKSSTRIVSLCDIDPVDVPALHLGASAWKVNP